MKNYSANEAKQGLGEVLDRAQREPVMISKHGRPFAVVVSYDDYQASETAKLEALRASVRIGLNQLDRGEGKPFDAKAMKKRLKKKLKKAAQTG